MLYVKGYVISETSAFWTVTFTELEMEESGWVLFGQKEKH